MLMNSVYLGVLCVIIAPMLWKSDIGSSESIAIGVTAVGWIPGLVFMWLLPGTITKFVMATSIEQMTKSKVVQDTLRAMKARRTLMVLKVLAGLKSSKRKSHSEDGAGDSDSKEGAVSRKASTAQRISAMDPATLLRKKNEIRAVFRMFDSGGDGSIEAHEIVKLLKATGWQGSDEEAQAIMQELDDDGSGEVSFDEFFSWCVETGIGMNDGEGEDSVEEASERIFEMLDADGSGTITASEMAGLFKQVCKDISEDDVMQLVNEWDDSGDGKLDREELEKMLRSVL